MTNYLTKGQLVNVLKRCGIKKGDIVLLHTDISKISKLKGTLKEQVELYLFAVKKVLGNKGTIVVPSYYYDYARKKKSFDVVKTAPGNEVGLFAKFFFRQKRITRSLNPLTSLAASGRKSKYICGGYTASSFGVDSPFERLTKLNAKMVFAGVDCRRMTYAHYVEFMVGVPHAYNKIFDVPIYKNKKKINLPVCNQVRYLEHLNHSVIYDDVGNTKKFEKAGLIRKAKFGRDYIRVASCKEIFNFLKLKLQKNCYYLLKKKPKFKKNLIPLV